MPSAEGTGLSFQLSNVFLSILAQTRYFSFNLSVLQLQWSCNLRKLRDNIVINLFNLAASSATKISRDTYTIIFQHKEMMPSGAVPILSVQRSKIAFECLSFDLSLNRILAVVKSSG